MVLRGKWRVVRLVLSLPAAICVILLISIPYYSFFCHRASQGALLTAGDDWWDTRNGVGDKFMPILLPACDRPEYLAPVLEGLLRMQAVDEVCV